MRQRSERAEDARSKQKLTVPFLLTLNHTERRRRQRCSGMRRTAARTTCNVRRRGKAKPMQEAWS